MGSDYPPSETQIFRNKINGVSYRLFTFYGDDVSHLDAFGVSVFLPKTNPSLLAQSWIRHCNLHTGKRLILIFFADLSSEVVDSIFK